MDKRVLDDLIAFYEDRLQDNTDSQELYSILNDFKANKDNPETLTMAIPCPASKCKGEFPLVDLYNHMASCEYIIEDLHETDEEQDESESLSIPNDPSLELIESKSISLFEALLIKGSYDELIHICRDYKEKAFKPAFVFLRDALIYRALEINIFKINSVKFVKAFDLLEAYKSSEHRLEIDELNEQIIKYEASFSYRLQKGDLEYCFIAGRAHSRDTWLAYLRIDPSQISSSQEKAVKAYTQGIDKSSLCLFELARSLLLEGKQKDLDQAVGLLERCLEISDFGLVSVLLGGLLHVRGQNERAFELFSRASETSKLARFCVYLSHLEGIGVEKDYQKAVLYREKANN